MKHGIQVIAIVAIFATAYAQSPSQPISSSVVEQCGQLAIPKQLPPLAVDSKLRQISLKDRAIDIRLKISSKGIVEHADWVRGPETVRELSLEWVRKITFIPANINGEAFPCNLTVRLQTNPTTTQLQFSPLVHPSGKCVEWLPIPAVKSRPAA